MDLRDLQYFVAVYEAQGFSRASRFLNTVQSNVSARIRLLERSLAMLTEGSEAEDPLAEQVREMLSRP